MDAAEVTVPGPFRTAGPVHSHADGTEKPGNFPADGSGAHHEGGLALDLAAGPVLPALLLLEPE
jgi:hypothetical protein